MVPTFTMSRVSGLGCPTMPLQHRHTYAADLRCGLRAGEKDTDRRSHPSAGADKCALLSRPASPRLEPVHSIERLSDRWFLTYTFPLRLPSPDRLGVPPRLVVVRAASHPPLHLQDQAALSFTGLLRQARGGALSSPPVSWRLVAHLLVHAQHDCPVRRVQVEAHDVRSASLRSAGRSRA